MTEFSNVYEDTIRAESYAKLEFPATYYLAYRDLPEIVARHARGRKAIDFGCGAGRSTRFLKKLGYTVTGVDISEEMVRKAREFDPEGDYRLSGDDGPCGLEENAYDLILSVFTFDNIPTMDSKVKIFKSLGALLKEDGRIVSLVSSPDVYKYEWASFSTKDFPENLSAKTGDKVRIIMTDVEDRRPVDDVIWYDDAYEETYRRSGLKPEAVYRPLARADEPYRWVNETRIPPWVIYVLKM